MAGILAGARARALGTERVGVGVFGVLTTMGGALSLVLSLRRRALFFRQSQGRRVQPGSWRCAGGGRCGALGRHDLGMCSLSSGP